ncbi:MAG: biotin carboxylase N-terminal domain-containing protein [Thermoanaerobaculia bacterium]|jgi:acetyl/propionyl-CoA carboxylase alpha subunit/acetyl-CoA carboxylase carboxyltransferase component|nr:biotin carboxylase N-terminal domain-containing protein [Thermoanaerobaculia bacterium]
MKPHFQRVAIVNRGEAAMRFINAVREFNQEHGTAIRTVALYTDPDRRAMFVREADEAYSLGPATVSSGDGERKVGYLDYARLETALATAGVDAVWTGWGFVSEHAGFAELCERLGIVFIGPPPDAMRRLSDKIAAKTLAAEAGVPVVPWSGASVAGPAQAAEAAAALGYPVVVKAAAGGGGRGIRVVASPDEMPVAFESARNEAFRAFGDATVFVEKLLLGVRHVEVQVLGDSWGTTWAVGVRDCTVQRRHQKVLEESPAPTLSDDTVEELKAAALRIARTAGYRNAGTVEFLFDPTAATFAFLEVNARLQVEHTVTEVTTGLDLVKLQIHVARGGRLVGDPPAPSGHAIEVRLNAEDPDAGFAPSPGKFLHFRLPTGPGLRIDRGVTEGDTVAPEFDPMIAKLIARGADRGEALARLRRALSESAVVLDGGTTNKAFLLELLDRPEVRSAEVDTGWLERWTAERAAEERPHAAIALLAAAVEAYDDELRVEEEKFYQSAARMRPEIRKEVGRTIEFRHRGLNYKLRAFRLDRHDYRVELDGRKCELRVEPLSPYERWLHIGGVRYRVLCVVQGLEHLVEVDGVPHRFSRDDLGILRAPSPAVVVSLGVSAGARVSRGQRIATLEAMKMEMPIPAPFDGVVRSVFVVPNVQVGPGTPLVQLDPAAPADAAAPAASRIALPNGPAAPVAVRPLAILDEIRRLVLGFDVDPADARRMTREYVDACPALASDPECLEAEERILRLFADVSGLFRRQTASEDPDAEGVVSTGEYLLTYLRTYDTQTPDLPPRFVDRLSRAAAHYGVEGTRKVPALREALLWIWKSRQRAEHQVEPLMAILERRLAAASSGAVGGSPELRSLLDRLVSVTEGRWPALGDVARDLRYRVFDQPAFEAARRAVYTEMERVFDRLAADPSSPEREDGVRRLVECPQPLQSLYMSRFEGASPAVQGLMLEVLTRRYYRIRTLEGFREVSFGGRAGALAEYAFEGVRHLVVTTWCPDDELDAALRDVAAYLAEHPSEHDVLVDVYSWRPGPLGEPDAKAAEVKRVADAAGLGPRVVRVVLALSAAGAGLGMGGMQHFTLRPGDGGFVEEKLYRAMHPMIGKRLDLWRLEGFDIERLPSAEDVYLFKGVARENPKDERLFALVEVRDLTPAFDAQGRFVGLPQMERMLLEAFEAIRHVQAHRRPEDRLQWNRVFVYVWPPFTYGATVVRAFAKHLAPAAEGLGMEKVAIQARIPDPAIPGGLKEVVFSVSQPGRTGITVSVTPPSRKPLRTLSEYEQKVVRLRQRGLTYPYEILRMLTPPKDDAHADFPPGDFVEHDLDEEGALVPVSRPPGRNRANIVAGLLTSYTAKVPEGMTRVVLLGDPMGAMGSLAEPECRRILAGLDLAEKMGVPLEWYALSAGAKIAMDSGTENMDWISRVLRRLITFTQAGGEVNVVVCGINVGAQPYWNAEATMLMHTRGILVMTKDGAMVLTGKTALDYSGSVSAEDNLGIGGYERVMGPNGQAQYWARDIPDACRILLRHYDHTYVVPGERFPRRAETSDPIDRDVCLSPHGGDEPGSFALVGEIFSDATNPGRKRPFEIRKVMAAAADQDHAPLERWAGLRDGENGVVWDAHIGGWPVCLLGFESHPVKRIGFVATDGPENWTSGTLFPQASKKIARAVNAASGNRPLVVLANLSGFDGSPESMRKIQLEYGAEIGRAVTNFKGPIVFTVVSRYHGGAFVVFSKTLNDNMEVAALEGTYASVIGGAPAAAVVFAREVDQRTKRDPRVAALEREMAAASDVERRKLRSRLADLVAAVRSEKLGEVADEFDRTHSVQRALAVGSLDRILPAKELRPYLVDAIERGMAKEMERIAR